MSETCSRRSLLLALSVAPGARVFAVDSLASANSNDDKSTGERYSRRKRQYHEMNAAAQSARLVDVNQFRSWFATQAFAEDFKAEVLGRIEIAVAAAELAWSDVQKTVDADVLDGGKDGIDDLIIAPVMWAPSVA